MSANPVARMQSGKTVSPRLGQSPDFIRATQDFIPPYNNSVGPSDPAYRSNRWSADIPCLPLSPDAWGC
jgi:hypothetical protein